MKALLISQDLWEVIQEPKNVEILAKWIAVVRKEYMQNIQSNA